VGCAVIGTIKALSNTGCPWPGGLAREFTQADVVAFGKLHCWGSSCVQFVVLLTDGMEVFVRADKQAKEDERWLRRLARKVPRLNSLVSRVEGWRTIWIEVDRSGLPPRWSDADVENMERTDARLELAERSADARKRD
jgi:hypothetical protein